MISQPSKIRAAQLWFTAPHHVEVRETSLDPPASDQVVVRTSYSAVSAGTELLLYRGQLPNSMALDSSIDSLQDSCDYPLQYGYACVGTVIETGSAVDPHWRGREVFAFQPHASHFLARTDALQVIPDELSPRDAVLLPNMETAVNLVQDARPMLGERVVVLGQGIVGLLLTSLLAEHPLASLAAIEGMPARQAMAQAMGADLVCSPQHASDPEAMTAEQKQALLEADLIFEVSGQPQALDLAINLAGYTGRIVIGSWYGNKSAPIDLGGPAHRNRLQLITSQVSTISPALTGRWNKQRRFGVAWKMLERVNPARLVTHTVPLSEAASLYQQLHDETSGVMQVLFDYTDCPD